MSSYTSLPRFYDSLTQDVPYTKIADYYEGLFQRVEHRVKTILDMACGTGTLTCLLSERGYDMIGTDASAEMLSFAADKATECKSRPMFINQSMEDLDLYGTVDAVTCSLDGINYVKPDKLEEVFRRVLLFLEPGGVFVFDIHTPSKLRSLDGQIFLDENEDVYCVWRTEFDQRANCCVYGMDIFARNGKKWDRSREEHVEYAYEPNALEKLLLKEGFTEVQSFGDMSFETPTSLDQRIFITARKPL